MKIILSPAKKMRRDTDSLPTHSAPYFLPEAQKILDYLRTLSFSQLSSLWGCSEAIALQNIQRLQQMDLHRGLTPAVLSYDGLAFQHMAPGVFTDSQLEYVQQHLRILSGFYGVLRPMDGITPYRLEMQAKAAVCGCGSLYEFWGKALYDCVRDSDGVIINLASREYSRCIEKYLTGEDTFITCVFAESSGGKPVQKGTLAKMARGEMVRFLAEHQITDPAGMQQFDRLGFRFCRELSSDREYFFLRKK